MDLSFLAATPSKVGLQLRSRTAAMMSTSVAWADGGEGHEGLVGTSIGQHAMKARDVTSDGSTIWATVEGSWCNDGYEGPVAGVSG